MQADVTLGLAVIAIMAIGGPVLAWALARLVYPVRERLFRDATALLAEPGLSRADRQLLNRYMNWALSFTAGWLVPLALLMAIGDKVARTAAPAPRRRVTAGLGARFCLSVLAANPVAAVLSLPLVVVLLVLAGVIEHERPREAVRDAAAKVPSAGRFLTA